MNIHFFDKVTISIIIVALVVYLIRMLPLVLFKKKITNKFLNSVFTYLPYGVITSLFFPEAFYCLASNATTHIPTPAELLTAIIGIIVAVVLALREKSLGLIIVSSVVVVFIVAKVLPFIPYFA